MNSELALRKEMVKKFNNQVKELKQCTDDSYVLAFDQHGLGVHFPDGKPAICCITKAEEVANDDMPEEAWAYIPQVHNGAGEKAKVVRRQVVIQKQIESLQGLIKDIAC